MYKFMARRVHDGKLTWDEVKGFKQAVRHARIKNRTYYFKKF